MSKMELESWMQREIAHHRIWRRIWSVLFFSTAALTIIAGAATTAAAGLLDAEQAKQWAIWLAAVTTVLASLEKVLRLREKWDLHRNIQTALEMVELRRSTGLIDDSNAIDILDRIAQTYNSQLAELGAPTRPRSRDTDANVPG
jgi:hypothetical protein